MADEPVKIAFCITELDPGGAERALYQIVTRLDPERFKVVVYSISGKGVVAEWLRKKGIDVVELEAQSKFEFRTLRSLIKEFQEFKPDIVQGFLFQGNIYSRLAGWWAGVENCLSGIRVAERRSFIFHLIDRWTERLVKKHVCVSEGVKEFSITQAGLDPKKLVVIPNGVDVETIKSASATQRQELGLKDSDFVVLSAGRLEQQKGHDFLLESVVKWEQRPEEFKLLIAGTGKEESSLRELIAVNKLEQCVQLLGYRDDFPGLLKMCDLYVQTSRYEGMCNAILEALAAGKKVITTRVEGIREVEQFKEAVRVINFGDQLRLIQQFEEYLALKFLNSNVQPILQVVDMKEFTWDKVSQKYAELYLQLLKIES